MRFSVIFLLILFFSISKINAQDVYMLSRQDSALIEKYITGAEESLNENKKKEATDFYNQIAMKYWEHNYLELGLKFYKKSLELNTQLGNRNAIAMINSNIALILADMKKYDESLIYFEQTFVVRKAKDEKIGMISALINMSVVLNNLKRYDESIKKLTTALDYAREINDTQQMRSCYGMLSESYQKAGDYEKSMYYFDYYKGFNELVQGKKVKEIRGDLEQERLRKQLLQEQTIRDSLELLVKQREIITKEKEIEVTASTNKKILKNMSKKELELEVLRRDGLLKKIEAKQAREEKIRAQRVSFMIILFVIIVGLLIFYAYWQKRKDNKKLLAMNFEILQQREEIQTQNEALEQSNEKLAELNYKLTSSINYAQYIQAAMLNRTVKITDLVKDAFVFFKPRDVVSGDFYYYAKVDNKVIVAAVDCTGHGVPGAFLSMIGNNILSRVVEYEKITQPDKILSELDAGVRSSLNQVHTDNRDGMDITLITIDYDNNSIQFAGAGNPLIYFINDEQFMIKGSPVAIGGYSIKSEKVFELNEFSFEKNDEIELYLFSDGFIDQFNADDNKRYMRKRFKVLLDGLHQKKMKEQELALNTEILEWRGQNPQLDDVIVIGLRV